MQVYVYGYTCMCPYARKGVKHVFIIIYMFSCVQQYFRPVQWDPNLAIVDSDPIRIRARCGPDT